MLKYSVLMTVWAKDDPKYFSLALDSMLRQTYKPDEIVIVKDGPIGHALQSIIDHQIANICPPPTTVRKIYNFNYPDSTSRKQGLGVCIE